MYNCFKCNASGIADYKFLQLIGIADSPLIREIQSFNSENHKSIVSRDFSSYNSYDIKNQKTLVFH